MDKKVLIVDDDPAICEVLAAELRERGFEAIAAPSPEKALEVMADGSMAAVVTDIQMAGVDGVELCEKIVRLHPGTPVLVMTAFGSMESAIRAIRAGAYDYVTKPCDALELALTLERAIRERDLKIELERLRAVASRSDGDAIIGESDAIRRIRALVEQVAKTETTVLVTGESGTGKELVARAIHAQSARARGTFVAINCAAMPESLLEAELFGHVRGAFTSAHQSRQGLFVRASGGTLFLDEIGEMPMGMQAKLLRALQERRVRPVGGDSEIAFDTRIVAATNRDLDVEVAERRFREDLFYRINVVRVHMPPLRARGRDILILAQNFLSRMTTPAGLAVRGFQSAAAEKLLAYPWPGNVRELQNCIERAVALAAFDRIGVMDLPERVREHNEKRFAVDPSDPQDLLPMEEVEKRYVLKVLSTLGGNKSHAAQVLGFDRRTLYRKLERWGEAPPMPGAPASAEAASDGSA